MEFKILENEIDYVGDNNKVLAYVTFPSIDDNTYEITHTVVDPSLRGQGIAAKLMELTYNEIKKRGKKVILTCSYAQSYFNKNKNLQDIIK